MGWPRIAELSCLLSLRPAWAAAAAEPPPDPVVAESGRLTLHAGYADLRPRSPRGSR